MRHYAQSDATRSLAPSQRGTGFRSPNFLVRDGQSFRMIAAMADPELPASRRDTAREAKESDAQYFLRRAEEERQAAEKAASSEARSPHLELAARYSRRARRAVRPPSVAARHRLIPGASVSDPPRRPARPTHLNT